MKQSKIDSFMEQVVSTAIGWCFAAAFWKFGILPMMQAGWFEVDATLVITSLFSGVSLLRGFIVRRLFNGREPWAAIKQFCMKA